ncbi:MAG: flagellar protein FlaG [Lachnospiraceae bacterium]|nr:flagellar protein FlaG [Lachnospiraceae bacterium]MBR5992451.1 flagellar protein FlaG [Lachnospiraceae bacterium]
MALEPINSIMTVQAQTIQPKPTSTKPSVEYTDVSLAADTPKVDNTTRVVENTGEKSDSNNKKEKEPSNETLHKAIEKINKQMTNSEAIYGFHDKTNRVTIKIIDKETKEVIKELPPEKTLDLIAKAWELAGILVDEKR